MVDGRAGYMAFLLLYLALVVSLCVSAQWLPPRMASHFGAEGRANDWMSRSVYLAFSGALPALFALMFAGMPQLDIFKGPNATAISFVTADALGISEANTKVRLLRARLQLRESLTRAFGDETRRMDPHRHRNPSLLASNETL